MNVFLFLKGYFCLLHKINPILFFVFLFKPNNINQ